MSTIKELAETCGVSEQAIRKWCARNQVAKDVAQRYIIDNSKYPGVTSTKLERLLLLQCYVLVYI